MQEGGWTGRPYQWRWSAYAASWGGEVMLGWAYCLRLSVTRLCSEMCSLARPRQKNVAQGAPIAPDFRMYYTTLTLLVKLGHQAAHTLTQYAGYTPLTVLWDHALGHKAAARPQRRCAWKAATPNGTWTEFEPATFAFIQLVPVYQLN